MGIIDEHVLNGTIILILVTCLTGSFVTANAGKRMAITEMEKLPEVINMHERILIPVNNPEKIEGLIDFAVMIHDDRERNPVYLLTVVQDEDHVKEKVLLSNKNMEQAIRHAASTETRVQLLTRVDLNMTNGVARAVKEMLISDVIIEWDEKSTSTTDILFNSLFGTATRNILDSTWETVYVCRMNHPLSITKKIVIALTKNAEYEIGFKHWVKKIIMLSRQLGAKLQVCGTSETRIAFQKEVKNNKSGVEISYRPFEDVEDFLILSREIKSDDLIVAVSARKGTLSYHSYMDNLPSKLTKHFPANNFILLYPEQKQAEVLESGMQSQDLTLTPIQEQIDNLNKLGKAVKKIFAGSAKTSETEKEE
jgi:hypothetical protein